MLKRLGCEAAWVVHGADGLDELTTTGPSHVVELANGRIRRFTVTPEDAGLSRTVPQALKGGDAADNAAAMRRMLEGAPGAYRDIVLLNAAAALVVAGKTTSLADGTALAGHAIDSGAALATLAKLIAITNRGQAA